MPSSLGRLVAGLAVSAVLAAPSVTLAGDDDSIRFTSFNSFMNRGSAGELISTLSTPDDPQVRAVAEIIQRINPDVILLNEVDYDAAGEAVALLKQNYLEVAQNDAGAIEFPYVYLAPSNTGLASGVDLDGNGVVGTEPGTFDYANDSFGFGFFEGQFAMVLLSKYPIDTKNVRTFQTFRWIDMPDAVLPVDPDTGESYYSTEALEVFRLSSKSHWDIPIIVGDGEGDDEVVHVLAAHPTPPVFDGPEDRNGRRNNDEIRFWADYVTPGAADYIYDDAGVFGGIAEGAKFVIMGDYNADPVDGDSFPGAINQLLDSALITDAEPASIGGLDAAIRQDGVDLDQLGSPTLDTADFNPAGPGNLRVDYVLPSSNMGVADASVFWPSSDEELFPLVGIGFPAVSSDHRAVTVDVLVDGPADPEPAFPGVYKLDFIGEATFETGFEFAGTEVGGLSGIGYDAGIDAYFSLSDDRSQFAPARFYALSIDLSDGELSDGDVAFRNLITLRQADGTAFPEFSLDPEGIGFSSTGDWFFASEGDANNAVDPFVDRFTPIGRQLTPLPIPSPYLTGTPDFGIRNNLAFESLTLNPAETVLFTATENALFQDGPPATVEERSPSRILTFDLTSDAAASEYVYLTDNVLDPPNPPGAFSTNGLVELLALTEDRLLAMERSFSVGVGNGIRLYEITTNGATDVAGLDSIEGAEVTPVGRDLVLDLARLGIVLDNVEGMTFGPRLPNGDRSLILVSDNNFNPNGQFTQFLAFAIDACPADLDDNDGVGFGDLLLVLAAFGDDCDDCDEDVTGDGAVTFDDVLAVLASWGDCPES